MLFMSTRYDWPGGTMNDSDVSVHENEAVDTATVTASTVAERYPFDALELAPTLTKIGLPVVL